MEKIRLLEQFLKKEPGLELAVLIGSRSNSTNRTDSDWDIAIRWDRALDFITKLGRSEALRCKLANQMKLGEQSIDLIDMADAGLSMRAEIAENGILLVGDNTLAWSRFLQRVWRELEEFYWDEIYAT